MVRLTSTRLALALAMLTAASSARASCPTVPQRTVHSTTAMAYGETATIPIAQLDLSDPPFQPCETVSFAITTTAYALMGFQVYNSDSPAVSLYEESWTVSGSDVRSAPVTPPWYTSIKGMRTIKGLPDHAALYCGLWGDCNYSIVITRTPRADYNLGDVSFASATSIALDTAQSGSVHQLEDGQFYKIHLAARG
jgi:hypothetical protein